MKLVAISDTHNRQKGIKEFQDIDSMGQEKEPLGGDIILHAGDATLGGTVGEVERFLKWYGELDFSHRIFVPGNHDWLFEKEPGLAAQMCKDNGVILLNDSGITINDINIWGSPVQPRFFNWAFNRDRGEDIKRHWDMIPKGTDILVTHSPPIHILDFTPRGGSVGCADLAYRINEIKPEIHIFGHIHHSAGQKHQDGVSYYNASVCNEIYLPYNPVTIIEPYIKGI